MITSYNYLKYLYKKRINHVVINYYKGATTSIRDKDKVLLQLKVPLQLKLLQKESKAEISKRQKDKVLVHFGGSITKLLKSKFFFFLNQ